MRLNHLATLAYLVTSTTILLTQPTLANTLTTNAAIIHKAPKWLKRVRAEKSIRRIERDMEWTIRRVQVHFYSSADNFQKQHNLGPFARAVFVPKDQTIHLGPLVTDKNFDQVFSHELVHVISNQKYKTSIPRWLEEGLANHLARAPKVDYKWLNNQPFKIQFTELTHPIAESRTLTVFRYRASQALAEMLDRKCKMTRLLQMSLESKMEPYLKTYCEIEDLNEALKKWIQVKAKKA